MLLSTMNGFVKSRYLSLRNLCLLFLLNMHKTGIFLSLLQFHGQFSVRISIIVDSFQYDQAHEKSNEESRPTRGAEEEGKTRGTRNWWFIWPIASILLLVWVLP